MIFTYGFIMECRTGSIPITQAKIFESEIFAIEQQAAHMVETGGPFFQLDHMSDQSSSNQSVISSNRQTVN